MKVFDLHCPHEHVFEGWFASEADFASQLARGLIECPLCGSQQLRKGLSAPRLNLGAQPPAAQRTGARTAPAAPATAAAAADPAALQQRRQLQAAWLQASRQIAARTEDVGDQFAEAALRMHRGDEPERAIRGQATPAQTRQLLEEGVPVLPLALPSASKETLQ